MAMATTVEVTEWWSTLGDRDLAQAVCFWVKELDLPSCRNSAFQSTFEWISCDSERSVKNKLIQAYISYVKLRYKLCLARFDCFRSSNRKKHHVTKTGSKEGIEKIWPSASRSGGFLRFLACQSCESRTFQPFGSMIFLSERVNTYQVFHVTDSHRVPFSDTSHFFSAFWGTSANICWTTLTRGAKPLRRSWKRWSRPAQRGAKSLKRHR